MGFLFVLLVIFNPTVDTYDMAADAIYMQVGGYAAHPLVKSPQKLYNVARLIVNGARRGNVQWQLSSSIAFFESSYRSDVLARDGRGSKGYMQLHGAALKYCSMKEGRKISMRNEEDQIICGSHWIRYAIDSCKGSIEQGLARYATGYMCDYRNSKSVSGIVKRRMKLFQKMVDKSEKRIKVGLWRFETHEN